MRLAYVAHPIRGDVPGNTARVRRWLRYLASADPNTAHIAPYLVDLEIWDDADEAQRELGLRRCEAAVMHCDVLILCGGEVTAGMRRERAAAEIAGVRVVDLTGLGPEPPGWTA